MISIVALVDSNNNSTDKAFDDSITSIINQTYKEWELKIVLYNIKQNDNSSIQNYKDIDNRIDIIKYFENEINTSSKALIKAAENGCKYNHIAILYMNDIWVPNKLELQTSILLKYPRIDVLGSKSIYESEVSCIPEGELYHYNILKTNPFINSTVIIKKNILKYIEEVNPFLEINVVLNILWVQLAIQQCVLHNMNDTLVKHNDNETFLHYKVCYNTVVFKKVLDFLAITVYLDIVNKNTKEHVLFKI